MKRIFVKLCSVAVIGLALTACNNDAANKIATDADNAAIDQMVSDKLKTLDDSLAKACDAQVTVGADAKIDSMAKAGHKTAKAHVANHPKPVAKKDEPAPSKQGGFGGAAQDTKNGVKPKEGGFGGAAQDAKNGVAPKQGGFGGAAQDAAKGKK